MTPPTAWSTAHAMTPPHLAKAMAVMKKEPMMEPATKADMTEISTRQSEPAYALSKRFLYPTSRVRTSKTRLAAVKPTKKRSSGLNMKLIAVAIRPTDVAAKNLRVHQTARSRDENPIRSQRKGS